MNMSEAPAVSFERRVVEWLLRRLSQSEPITGDVLLVEGHSVLAECPASVSFGGAVWRRAFVNGELSLREALAASEAAGERTLLIVPPGLVPPPDVRARAHLRRKVAVRVEDIIAALAARPCMPLDDPELEQLVLELLPRLQQRTGMWTLYQSVQPPEVRAVVTTVLLDLAGSPDRAPPGAILAKWLISGIPDATGLNVLQQALADAHGLAGEWLGWLVATGAASEFVSAGALASGPAGRIALPQPLKIEADRLAQQNDAAAVWAALAAMVHDAAQRIVEHHRQRLRELLAPAEQLFLRLRLPAAEYPLLETAFELQLTQLADAAAAGKPGTAPECEALRGNVHAAVRAADVSLTLGMTRLARFIAQPDAPTAETRLADWAIYARDSAAWADLAARDVRRLLPAASPPLQQTGNTVLTQFLAVRDAANRDFAIALAGEWNTAAWVHDPSQPFAIHQLAGSLIRPLLDHVDRLFLIVLDACDLSTFLEIAASFEPLHGLTLPSLASGPFADAVTAAGAFRPLLSLLPTVTARARRGLFAGQIPGNPLLDDWEAEAASASGDQQAFDRCPALAGLSRRLFLKGQLRGQGADLVAALAAKEHRLIAAVFNAIDDALASKETAPAPAWTTNRLGPEFTNALRAALSEEWTVIMTADHGHTPFWTMDRKLPGPAEGARFRLADGPAPAGQIEIGGTEAPGGPFLFAVTTGAFWGGQRSGFHGGASLEEMIVPLAFLGITPSGGRPAAPAWWDGIY